MEIKKIVIAPDSFKGCLSASDVAECCVAGVREVFPDAEVVALPIADGGEGTADALAESLKGEFVHCQVSDPLGRGVTGRYLIGKDGEAAVIETASAAGLPLLSEEERNPMKTTTFGLGELIMDAAERGCREICVGLGGSATNDGGMGMLAALGVKFLDSSGRELAGRGENLSRVERIVVDNVCNRLKDIKFTVACDVDNPFCGPDGAAFVFAPQKGADPEMVRQLDNGMSHFAEIVRGVTGINVATLPGAGAAGGLGGAFAAFLGGRLVPGIDMVLDVAGFENHLSGADLIITGEGSVDAQSLMGKVVSGVLKRAKVRDVPVAVIAGAVKDVGVLNRAGVCAAFSIQPGVVSLKEAVSPSLARENICRVVCQMMRLIRYAGQRQV